jgi:hypothetical protein
MKKLFFVLALFMFVTLSSQAQLSGMLDKAKSVAGAAGFDVSKLSSGIMGKLTPALSLTQPQQPKVTDAVTSYLTQKANILPLQTSNPTQYQQKQSGLFANLKSKLTGILLQNQMNKFLGLKPATNSPTNILSQLFY